MGGATGKALLRYGQQMGSQEFSNAFNRYQTTRAAQLDPLFKLYSGGQASAAGSAAQAGALGQNLGSTYSNLGSNLGQAAIAGGQAQASGYLNQANAINNALTQGTSSYLQGQYLNRLAGGTPLAPMYGGTGLY